MGREAGLRLLGGMSEKPVTLSGDLLTAPGVSQWDVFWDLQWLAAHVGLWRVSITCRQAAAFSD